MPRYHISLQGIIQVDALDADAAVQKVASHLREPLPSNAPMVVDFVLSSPQIVGDGTIPEPKPEPAKVRPGPEDTHIVMTPDSGRHAARTRN